jgi:hypothetical protein
MEGSNAWCPLEGFNDWWPMEGSNAWCPLEGFNDWWPMEGSNVWWLLEGEGKAPFSPLFTFPLINFT